MREIVVDVGSRVVHRGGSEVRLPPKAFDLLLILVRHQPNAVPHEQLHAALWPGVHVSETSLAALVTQLRKALGDAADTGQTIRTLHRVGYAFIGQAVVKGDVPTLIPPRWRLVWRGETIDVPAGESVVGRDRGCAIRIDAESISRHHARLSATGDDISIRDLGSKNGTWINGERIHGSLPLADAACLQLGSERIRLELIADERPTKTVLPE